MATNVREKPILFSGPMVRAILEGRKTQTRRVVTPQPARDPYPCHWVNSGWALEGLPDDRGIKGCSCSEIRCPYIANCLWVRETWRAADGSMETHYRADIDEVSGGPWKPAIHMHRVRSRLTLEITNIRVERLQDISEADAAEEGMGVFLANNPQWDGDPDCYRKLFRLGWDFLNAKRKGCAWADNPWLWCISFQRTETGEAS